ncbi:hypothetical protein sos41_15330 [Alphaproteobacteria bacterium SO-S41]|nr:hypothetical protein sos41_15330 [Alphaproteobacteria bacterium SO-S41]
MFGIPVDQLAFYVIVGAGALCLLMALISMDRLMRAAGFIVLAVSIALLAMWIQNQAQILFLVVAGVAAIIAFLFMASSRTPLPSDMKGLSTSGK